MAPSDRSQRQVEAFANAGRLKQLPKFLNGLKVFFKATKEGGQEYYHSNRYAMHTIADVY
jgi:hypothetical protein